MAVYNVFEATNARLKNKNAKKTSESGMAGAAKTPASAATASKEELKAMAARVGWEVRPLTFEEVQKMSSSELRFHEVWNKDALDLAFSVAANQRTNAERMPAWNARRMWSGNATEDETAKAAAAGAEFAKRFPQFERSLPNAKAMAEFMNLHDLDATELQSYVTAFRELNAEGKLKLAEAQSADDFFASHSELHDRRTPPIIHAREQRKERTAELFGKAKAATAESGSTRLTDYPADETGYPSHPSKYSFRRLLDSLSAAEFQKRLNEDTAFAAAVNKL